MTKIYPCFHYVKRKPDLLSKGKTDKHNAYFDMPGATCVDRVVRKSVEAAKQGVAVCTPDPVSTLHRMVASVLPHALLARICK